MSRFTQELAGAFGPFWQAEAEKALAAVKADLESGKIIIDEAGVARNRIGRVLMDDMLEKLALVTDRADCEATRAAREAEVERELAEYRASRKRPDSATLAEMRAAFGAGTRVVDVLSGEVIEL